MTSINAVRFNGTSGALICDEQRHWNDERLKSLTAEKIRAVVEPRITEAHRLAAAYGNTGTSTIGEEIRHSIGRRVSERYCRAVDAGAKTPEGFMSMFDLAELAFDVVTEVKHRHVDEQLKGRFGFDTLDFAAGKYSSGGAAVEIAQKDVVDAADDMVSWSKKGKDTKAVFGNAGILAGYSPADGFQMFQFSMSQGFWRPCASFFIALGSGSDSADFSFMNWARALDVDERRGALEPAEAMLAAVTAVNEARTNNLGVDGYFKIILIDGSAAGSGGVYREICDHRSRLLSEAAAAHKAGLLSPKATWEVFEGVLFGGMSLDAALSRLWKDTPARGKLDRFLRGYSQ